MRRRSNQGRSFHAEVSIRPLSAFRIDLSAYRPPGARFLTFSGARLCVAGVGKGNPGSKTGHSGT
jgi:hypothetical protein